MGFDLYLMGHGCYRPKNGYVVIPKDYSMHFYTEHGRGLQEEKLSKILRGKIQPVQNFEQYSSLPNYTWGYGNRGNWNYYVVGGARYMGRRGNKILPVRWGKNEYLKLERRSLDWDVRYVNFFKEMDGMRIQEEYTLSMLLDNVKAQQYFSKKIKPIKIHVLLCLNQAGDSKTL